MRKYEVVLVKGGIDSHGDVWTVEALESSAQVFNAQYTPVGVEHDIRQAPVGRVIEARVVCTDSGVHELRGTLALWDEADTEESLSGDGRAVAIGEPPGAPFAVLYDRAWEGTEDLAFITDLARLVDGAPKFVIKKAVDPIGTLVIVAGAFAVGALAKSFFGELGKDLYNALKAKLRDYFARSRVRGRRLVFTLYVGPDQQLTEVQVIIDNVGPQAIEAFLSSGLQAVDETVAAILARPNDIARIALEYQESRIHVLYTMRRDGVPSPRPTIPHDTAMAKGLSVAGTPQYMGRRSRGG